VLSELNGVSCVCSVALFLHAVHALQRVIRALAINQARADYEAGEAYAAADGTIQYNHPIYGEQVVQNADDFEEYLDAVVSKALAITTCG
jgi:hypothetical protein